MIQYKCYPNQFDDHDKIIPLMSNNFNLIDQSKLINLPSEFVLKIISDENLKIESEDFLFDFIIKIIKYKKEQQKDEIVDDNQFFEQIKASNLSKKKKLMNLFNILIIITLVTNYGTSFFLV